MPTFDNKLTSGVLAFTLLGCTCISTISSLSALAHEGHKHPLPTVPAGKTTTGEPTSAADRQLANSHFEFFAWLISRWPTKWQDQVINQAYAERRAADGSPHAISPQQLSQGRDDLLKQLSTQLPHVEIEWNEDEAIIRSTSNLRFTDRLATPCIVFVRNSSTKPISLRAFPKQPDCRELAIPNHTNIPPDSSVPIVAELVFSDSTTTTNRIELALQNQLSDANNRSILLDANVEKPTKVTVHVIDTETDAACPARITIVGSDGICRSGGEYGEHNTLTQKPIIYPPINVWQKLPFFYTNRACEIYVPAGITEISATRGFEHELAKKTVDLAPAQSQRLTLKPSRIADLKTVGWYSADTHVHWVTNQWNIDEPLELLDVVQKAEDIAVVNNLTLLQRYANQAFISPSQAPMGPIEKYCKNGFHVEMGEEYRNEDLYGHLCFLNLQWLVQPLGTGSIIAGPDALDYPINRTAIEACRQQGGISIEAHGTGGNKDVPVNVIHNLTDSLDQMEPDMYYRLLDCGFRLPLTNGSDHPARPLGIARAYVRFDGDFSYSNWINGIRKGRTFTTSGPLLFLTVNNAKIGDVIDVAETKTLSITAKAISKFPIGRLQIVSNQKVIREIESDQLQAELNIEVPADESRWIVARCSNRQDGRTDFGFGNFNAITGPGIAHTSPIYVHVNGKPRFDAVAAAYWQDQMRLHLHDIQAKGRFADDQQRAEAVGYIQQGITMFKQLESQITASRRADESWENARDRLANVVLRFGGDSIADQRYGSIRKSETLDELRDALQPLVLFQVSINPESRVKIQALSDRIQLTHDRPQRFLIAIENTAGVTAPLQIQAFDMTSLNTDQAPYLDAEIIDDPFVSKNLTGAFKEYKVVQLNAKRLGMYELRFVGDAGQGTQDLGFRATADVLIEAK